jgi:hypothetical protein
MLSAFHCLVRTGTGNNQSTRSASLLYPLRETRQYPLLFRMTSLFNMKADCCCTVRMPPSQSNAIEGRWKTYRRMSERRCDESREKDSNSAWRIRLKDRPDSSIGILRFLSSCSKKAMLECRWSETQVLSSRLSWILALDRRGQDLPVESPTLTMKAKRQTARHHTVSNRNHSRPTFGVNITSHPVAE